MATYPNVNAANQYARDVVNGKILACRFTILACQRHLDDLERAKDPKWPYRFDKNKAERFLRFSQKMPHTSGEWARRKLRIDFEPWQKFSLGVPFGWVRRDNGFRRFTEIYIEVPRKNGKSAIAAAVGNYMFCADGEYAAEVYCGATTEKQAWKVFAPALAMVKKLPSLRMKFGIKPWAKKMTRPDGSLFAPIIGDPGDGDSPSCAIIDEYHEHDTDALYTTMTTGMGAREQPITLIITTAGFDITSPCYEKRLQVVEILERIREGGENEAIFGIIYTLDDEDDWTKPEALIKANPNYGVSIKESFLKAKQLLAMSTPSQTNKILTKHFNKWVSAKAAYYNLQKWMAAADKTLKLSDFTEDECYLGIDLASKLDLNAVVPVFRREINGLSHYYCVSPMFWVPEDTVYSTDPSLKTIAERYQSFVNQGVLVPTDGAEVDYRIIFESILTLRNTIKVASCPIDPYGATGISHMLQDEGLEPITITQNYTNMSDPMREIEAAIAAGRFHHDGNPLMNWCVSNVVGTRGELAALTEGQKTELLRNSAALDHLNAVERLKSLNEDLLKPEEALLNTTRERIKLLREAAPATEEYRKTMERISKASVQEAPKFGGIDSSVGGASGELIRVADAQKELAKWYDTQLEMQKKLLDEKEINEQTYADRVAEINKTNASQLESIQAGYTSASLAMFSDLAGQSAQLLQSIGQEGSIAYKTLFIASKAAAMAQAVINTELAATKAMAEGGLIMGIPAATAIRAVGYASVAMIAGQSLAGMAHDGIDRVPETGTWLLQKGERVVTASTSAKLDATLERVQQSRQASAGGTISIQNSFTGKPDDATLAAIDQRNRQLVISIRKEMAAQVVKPDNDFGRALKSVYPNRRQG